MPKMIEVCEAQSRLQKLLAQVLAGMEIILTDGSTPVARVLPVSQRVAGLHAGKIWTSADFDEPLPDEFWTRSA
jgi:antitoxin (DNA-binding transcriptional repressor) of toxin-antitoxin stability system